jgi:large subunit ribosomal protein L10
MDKEQKAAAIAEIAERLGDADAVIAVDYRGISVPQAAELRTRLREAEATFAVVKNRLAKRAAEESGTDGLDELLEGPTALTFVSGDIVTAAKAISSFNREHDVVSFKGGLMEGEALDEDRFMTLARLPTLETMHGQLVGMAASPLTGLVRGLGSMVSGLAVALGQIQEQGLVGGDEPAEEQEPEAEAQEEPAAEAEEQPDEGGEEGQPQEVQPEGGEEEQPAAEAEEAEPAPEAAEETSEPDEEEKEE